MRYEGRKEEAVEQDGTSKGRPCWAFALDHTNLHIRLSVKRVSAPLSVF